MIVIKGPRRFAARSQFERLGQLGQRLLKRLAARCSASMPRQGSDIRTSALIFRFELWLLFTDMAGS